MPDLPEDKKSPKYSIEIKQREDGEFYLASFKLNSDSDEELFDSLNLCMEGINRTLGRLNSARHSVPKPSVSVASQKAAPKVSEAAAQKPKEKAPKKPVEEIILTPEEIKLYTALRDLRNDLALRDNCPTYMVVPNSTIRMMAKNKPETKEDMLKISGMGEKRFERYGQDFVEMIKTYKTVTKIEPQENLDKA